MRTRIRTALAATALAALAGCAGPTTTVRAVDTRPAIAVQGAAPGLTLFVDGVRAGDPAAFDGNPGVLRVEPGTHDLELRDAGGAVVFRQRVFVESELKTILVR